MDTSSATLRPLAWACYAVGLLLFVAPLGDLASGIGSLNPGAVPWRFGAAGLLSGALVLPMLALALWFASAVLLRHRGVLRALSLLSAAMLLLVGGTLVVFALDTLQLRVQVGQDTRRAFDLAALKATVTFLLESAVLAVLAVNFHESAKALRGTRSPRRNDASPLFVPPKER